MLTEGLEWSDRVAQDIKDLWEDPIVKDIHARSHPDDHAEQYVDLLLEQQ